MRKDSRLWELFGRQIGSLKFLAALIGLGISFGSHGQGRWGVRLNQNTDFISITYSEFNAGSYKDSKVSLNRVSVALLYYNRKYTHEVELSIPQVDGSTPTFPWAYSVNFPENRYSNYSIRYTILRNMYSPTKWFSLSLGGGLNGYFLKVANVPQAGISFPVSDSMLGVSLNAIPGFNVRPSKHLSFVLDCPLKVFDIYYKTVYVRNPAIPIRQQKERSFETDFLMSAITVRLGVAYRFAG